MAEVDYYEVLGISRDATTLEIRKAYKKMALSYHPDKVPEDQRDEAEIMFKQVCEAYEVLSNESDREYYDRYRTRPGAGGMPNHDDMFGPDDFAQFFGGFGGGGIPRQQPPRRPTKTEDAHITIDVTLEDLYKGKVYKMNSVRDVLCKHCSGKGCRERAKPKKCTRCDGHGVRKALRRVGPGMVTNEMTPCETCKGRGETYRDKDLCKRCKGSGTMEEKSVLEVYVPRGAKDGQKIVLEGKSDESYGMKAGDIIFTVNCEPHAQFQRRGKDLLVEATITLTESLCGFQRTLFTHLDGRGIQVSRSLGKVTKPNSILQVKGEGMPVPGLDSRGDLYIAITIEFPRDNWFMEKNEVRALQNMIPMVPVTVEAKEVDDVDFVVLSSIPDSFHEPEESEHDETEEGEPECSTM